MLQLVKPSMKYKESFLEAAKEFSTDPGTGFTFNGPEGSFEEFLATMEQQEKGINLPEGHVPQTKLWLVDKDKFLGLVKIRHELNKALLIKGGHIGYGIRPTERNKGYGNKILELALPVAKSLGIKKALVTCDDDNIGSAKIIENNGGILENKIEFEGKLRRRYWIEIK
jgi:predicted acetyltransferase